MWFVAGFNNGATQSGFKPNFCFEEISALRDLKTGFNVLLSETDSTSTGEYAARNKKRREKFYEVQERYISGDLIVFVRAVTDTLAICVVLVNSYQFSSKRAGKSCTAFDNLIASKIPQRCVIWVCHLW